MSDVKRFWQFDESLQEGPVECVLASDYDALAQRCREHEGALRHLVERNHEVIERQAELTAKTLEAVAERDTLRAEVVAYQMALADERGRHATAEINLRAELDACMLLSKIEFDDCSEDTIKSRNAEIAKLRAEVEALREIREIASQCAANGGYLNSRDLVDLRNLLEATK